MICRVLYTNTKNRLTVKDFEDIYKEYYPQVYKYVLGLCMNETCAEDITQETFYKAFKAVNGYRGECRFSVWLCQIAKNTYIWGCGPIMLAIISGIFSFINIQNKKKRGYLQAVFAVMLFVFGIMILTCIQV